MTATQPKTDDRRMGRRDLMRRTAIGAGAAVGVGASAGSASADDDDDDFEDDLTTATFWLASPPAAAAVTAYGYLFEDDTEEDFEGAQEYEAHLNLYNRTQESRLQISETLASLQRDVQLVPNKAREEAIFRIWEAGVDGLDEQAAEDAAEEAIQDAFATVEESILTSWTIRYERFASLIGTDLVPVESEDVMYGYRTDGDTFTMGRENNGTSFEGSNGGVVTHTLVDGTTMDVPVTSEREDDFDHPAQYDPIIEWRDPDEMSNGSHHQLRVAVPDHEDYDGVDDDPHDHTSPATAFDAEPWSKTYDNLIDEYDDMMAEVSSMVDTYFEPAQDGEIDLSQMLGPAHLTDTAADADDFEEAALALRAMGYKLADEATEIEVEFEGETLTLQGRLARTMDDPNPLPVGEEIDPDLNAGSIFAAINVEDEDGLRGETTELVEPFTIVSAGGASEVTFESRQLAGSDHELTAEEIAEIFEQNRESDEEAREVVHEIAVGGGGISLPGLDGDVNLGIVAAGVAVGAYLLGR